MATQWDITPAIPDFSNSSLRPARSESDPNSDTDARMLFAFALFRFEGKFACDKIIDIPKEDEVAALPSVERQVQADIRTSSIVSRGTSFHRSAKLHAQMPGAHFVCTALRWRQATCVEAVRQVDRPSMPEDREADNHDESVEQEPDSFRPSKSQRSAAIRLFARNQGQARARHPALDLAERPRR
jgi:hypothetical protein